MAQKSPAHGGSEMTAMLRNSAPKFLPLLRADEPFCVWDFGMSVDRYHHLTEKLKSYGALKEVDTKRQRIKVARDDGRDSSTVNRAKVYRLLPKARQILQAEQEREDTLHCGHRSHIYNPGEIDGFGCKYCQNRRKTIPRIEGYSKAQLERLL